MIILGLLVVVGVLALLHGIITIRELTILRNARNALSPPPQVLPGECAYQRAMPPEGAPDQLYCSHPRKHCVLESVQDCASCESRLLPYQGAKYLDYIYLDDFLASVLRKLLSLAIAIIAVLLSLLTLLEKLEKV